MYHLNDRGQQTTQNTNLVNNASTISHDIPSQIYNPRLVNIDSSSNNTVHSTQHLSTPTSTYVSNTTALRQWRRSNLKTTPSPHLSDARTFSSLSNNQILVKPSLHVENNKYQNKLSKNITGANIYSKNNCIVEIQQDKAINHNSNNNQLYSQFGISPQTGKHCNYISNKNAPAYKEVFCPNNTIQNQESANFRLSDEGKNGYGDNKYMYHTVYQHGNVPFNQMYNEVKQQELPLAYGDMSTMYSHNKLKSTDINSDVIHDLKSLNENSRNCHVINYSQNNSFKNENTGNVLPYQNPELIGSDFTNMKQINHNNYKSDIVYQHRNPLNYEYNYKYYTNNNYNANIPTLPLPYYHSNNVTNPTYTGNSWPQFYNNNTKVTKQQSHSSYTTDPYTQHLTETELKLQRGDVYTSVQRHDIKSLYNNGVVKHHYADHIPPKYPVNVPNISNYSYKHSSLHWDQSVNMTCAHPIKSTYPNNHVTENHCDNILINDKYPFHGISLNGGRIENSVNCAVAPHTTEFYSHTRSNDYISNGNNLNIRPFMQNTSDINISQYNMEPNIYYNGNKNVPYVHPAWPENQFSNNIYTDSDCNYKFRNMNEMNHFSSGNTISSSNNCLEKQAFENTKCKSSLNLKQFLETWDDTEENDENTINNLPDVVLSTANLNSNQNVSAAEETNSGDSQSQMFYILESTNISAEVVQNNYKHIQQIDKLPDNIKLVNDQKTNQSLSEISECVVSKCNENSTCLIPNTVNNETTMNKIESAMFTTNSINKNHSISENNTDCRLKTNMELNDFDLKKNIITKSVIELNPSINDNKIISDTKSCSLNIYNSESLCDLEKSNEVKKQICHEKVAIYDENSKDISKETDGNNPVCTKNNKDSMYDIQLKRKDTVIKSSTNLNIKYLPVVPKTFEFEKEIKSDSYSEVIKPLKHICQDVIKNCKNTHLNSNDNCNQKDNFEKNEQVTFSHDNRIDQIENKILTGNTTDDTLISPDFKTRINIHKKDSDVNENNFKLSDININKIADVIKESTTFNDLLERNQYTCEDNMLKEDILKQNTDLCDIDKCQNYDKDFPKDALPPISDMLDLETVLNPREISCKTSTSGKNENVLSENIKACSESFENIGKIKINVLNEEQNLKNVYDNEGVDNEECSPKTNLSPDEENEKLYGNGIENQTSKHETLKSNIEEINILKNNMLNRKDTTNENSDPFIEKEDREFTKVNENNCKTENDKYIEKVIVSDSSDSKIKNNIKQVKLDTPEILKEQLLQINKITKDNISIDPIKSITEHATEASLGNQLNLFETLDSQKEFENHSSIIKYDVNGDTNKDNKNSMNIRTENIELKNENLEESTTNTSSINTSELLPINSHEKLYQNSIFLEKSVNIKTNNSISKDLKINIISNEAVKINNIKLNENDILENMVTSSMYSSNKKFENILDIKSNPFQKSIILVENKVDNVYNTNENSAFVKKNEKYGNSALLINETHTHKEITEHCIRSDTADACITKQMQDFSEEILSEIPSLSSPDHQMTTNITSSNKKDVEKCNFNQTQKQEAQKSNISFIEDTKNTLLDENMKLSSLTDSVEKVQMTSAISKSSLDTERTTPTGSVQNNKQNEKNVKINNGIQINVDDVNSKSCIRHEDIKNENVVESDEKTLLNNSTNSTIENLTNVQKCTEESEIKDSKNDLVFCNEEINCTKKNEDQTKESMDNENPLLKPKFQSNQLILIIQTYDSHNCQETIPLTEQESNTPDSEHVIVQDYEETEITVGSDDENNIYIQIPITGDTHSDKSLLNIPEEVDVETESNQIYEIYNDDIDPLLDNCEVEIENHTDSEGEYSQTTHSPDNNITAAESNIPINECDSTFHTNDMELQSNEVTESKTMDDNMEISSTCDYYQPEDKITGKKKPFSEHFIRDDSDIVQNETCADSKAKKCNGTIAEELESNLVENDVLDDWLYTEEIITSPRDKLSLKNTKFKLKRPKSNNISYKHNRLNIEKRRLSIKKNGYDKKCELNYKDEAIQVNYGSYFLNFHNNNNNNNNDNDTNDNDDIRNAEFKLKHRDTMQGNDINLSVDVNPSIQHDSNISITNSSLGQDQNFSIKPEMNTCDSTTKNFDLQNDDVTENSSEFFNLQEVNKSTVDVSSNKQYSINNVQLKIDLKRKFETSNTAEKSNLITDWKREKHVKKIKYCHKNKADNTFKQTDVHESNIQNDLQKYETEVNSKKKISVPSLKIKPIKPVPSFSDVLQGIDTYVVKQTLSKFKIPKLKDGTKNKPINTWVDYNRNIKKDENEFNSIDYKQFKKIETAFNINDDNVSKLEFQNFNKQSNNCIDTTSDSLKIKFMNTEASFSSQISDHHNFKEYSKNVNLNLQSHTKKIKKKYLDLGKFKTQSKTDRFKDKHVILKRSRDKKYVKKALNNGFLLKTQEGDKDFHISKIATSDSSWEQNDNVVPKVIIKRSAISNKYASTLSDTPLNNVLKWQPFVKLHRNLELDKMALKQKVKKKIILHINRVNHNTDSFSSLKCKIKLDNKTKKLLPHFKDNQYK